MAKGKVVKTTTSAGTTGKSTSVKTHGTGHGASRPTKAGK